MIGICGDVVAFVLSSLTDERTIRDCDKIIVLEQGKAVQQGTHEKLWYSEGKYAFQASH